MSYKEIKWKNIKDEERRKLFSHADMFLRDVYGMFKRPIDKSSGEGGCNFSILLVLLCIIDGLSVYIYPSNEIAGEQEKRFKKLIRDKMYWEPAKRKWYDLDMAAKYFYLELRNPLIHELGANKITSARMKGYNEPVVGKWATIPESYHDIDYIDNLDEWNNDWPIMFIEERENGACIKVCVAALYWATKTMIIRFVEEELIAQE